MSNPTSIILSSPKDYFRMYNKKYDRCSCKNWPGGEEHSPLCSGQIEECQEYEIIFNDYQKGIRRIWVHGKDMLKTLQLNFGTLLRDRILMRCSIKRL